MPSPDSGAPLPPLVIVALVAGGLALVLQGCAGRVDDRELVAGGQMARARPAGFQVSEGRPGIVIGVPEDDAGAGRVGRDLARLTGFGVVVETGSSRSGDEALAGARRPGRAPALATRSGAARWPDEAYERQVDAAARGPLELYVELRADAAAAGAERVQIATLGLDREETWRLKTLFELIRDARVDGRAAPRLEVRVEPPDPPSTVSAAPPSGVPGAPRRALRIELPRLARTTYREVYTELLGDFLVQSAAFLVPRVR